MSRQVARARGAEVKVELEILPLAFAVGISAFAERFCGSIERLAPPQLLVRSAA